MSFCSIHTRVLQTSKGYTAAARFAYQTCSTADDRFGHVDYRRYAPCRVAGGVLLPMGAPADLAEWANFSKAVVSRETRRNAQEGRILDFALPRGVARELLLPLAAFALVPFIELGMAVRLDVEFTDASDGKPNPHAHAWLAQRELKQGGFGLKVRSWNEFFRRHGTRYIRAIVAARLTMGCAILGIEAYVDPRCNDLKGAGVPELRLTRTERSIYKKGGYVEKIEQLKASRQLKRDHKAAKHAPEAAFAGLKVTNAATYHRDDDDEAAELGRRFADAAQEAGYELESELDVTSGLPRVSLSGTAVAFDGRAFNVAGTGTSEDVAILARFARRLDWPALVVEGGARLADLMAVAGADEGVFMVNRAPGPAARDLIVRAFLGEMKATLALHDPLGIVAECFAKFEANKVGTQVGATLDALLQDVGCEDHPQSQANLMVPSTAALQPRQVAAVASAAAPIAPSATDSRRVAAGGDLRRTAVSSSEAIARRPGPRREAPRPPLRVGVGPNKLPRSPAELRLPSTARIQPSDVAAPASAVAPIAPPGNNSPRVADGSDERRTAAPSSETIARTSGPHREAPRPLRVGLASNNRPRSPADLRLPSTAPVRPSDVAEPASTVAPIATSDNNGLRVTVGAGLKRTASSAAFDDLEMLPDSWMATPDPLTLARKARALEEDAERQRETLQDYDKVLARFSDRSARLRRDGSNSPGSARFLPPTRRSEQMLQWPAEIPAVGDQAVETEEPEDQGPRP